MKDRNLLRQKLALIASNAVLSDSVINALDDAVALLGEDAEEIDKLRRHNASLVANQIQGCSICDVRTNTLKNARIRVENNLNDSEISMKYDYDSLQYMYYCKGIRDACWAIDDMISEQEEKDE